MSGWTDDRIAILREAVADGKAASEVAEPLGITRSAAIGKAWRMGLSFGAVEAASPRAKAARARYDPNWTPKVYVRKPAPPKLTVVPQIPDKKPPKSVDFPGPVEASKPRHWSTRRYGECCWPIGEGADLLSCCAPVERECYCAAHAAIAFQPPKKRAA